MQLSEAELVDPFAKILVSSYIGAAADARSFTAEWNYPPTRMQKVHTFRSVVQAHVLYSDRYALHGEYSEQGRVQVTDTGNGHSYLIRSRSMIDIDEALKRQLVLFELPRQSPRSLRGLPSMLAYKFERKGMTLWICATKQVNQDSRRLVPAGKLELLGFWPFVDETIPPSPNGGGERFDQGDSDPFADLGNPDIDDLGEAGGL